MLARSLCIMIAGMLILAGCSSKKTADTVDTLGLPYEVKESYWSTSSLLDEAPSTLKSYRITASDNDLQLLVEQYDELMFTYDAAGLSDDARKFCAHHNPEAFPIYDSYVDRMLRELRNRDRKIQFRNDDLKDYSKFVNVIRQMQKEYRIEKLSFRQVDIMLWLAGKEYFPQR